MRILRKLSPAGAVTQVEDDTFTFVVSTSDPDRDHDVLPVGNWSLDNFKKNPVALWSHDHSQPPIGKWTSVWQAGGKLMGKLQFAATEFAQTIRALVQGKFIQTASVGFRPIGSSERNNHGGVTYTGPMELLEISLVPIPSNPHALLQAKAQGINTALVAKYFDSPKEDNIVLDIITAKGKTECPRGKDCPLVPHQWAGDCAQRQHCPFLAGIDLYGSTLHRPPGWMDPSENPMRSFRSYAEGLAACRTPEQKRRFAEIYEPRKMGVGPVGAS